MSLLLALSSVGCAGHAQQDPTGSPESAGSPGTSLPGSGGTSSESAGGGFTIADSDADKRPSTLELDAWGGPAGKVATVVLMTEPGAGPQETCAPPLNDGACQVTTCTLGGIGSPGGGYGDFGPITASVGAATVTLTYDGYGYGTTYFPDGVTLGTGGTMKFHGGGAAGVPQFSVSATIPGLAVLTSPLPKADGDAVIIDTSEDLTLNWSPISIGQIRFYLAGGGYDFGRTDITLECTFEGAAGSGVVSHPLLSAMKEKAPPGSTYARLTSELDATTVVGGLTITTRSHQQSAVQNRDLSVTLE